MRLALLLTAAAAAAMATISAQTASSPFTNTSAATTPSPASPSTANPSNPFAPMPAPVTPGFQCTPSFTASQMSCAPAAAQTPVYVVANPAPAVSAPTVPPAQTPAQPAQPVVSPAPVLTGGPCSNADGSVGLFVQLPDGSCLPIVVTGSTTSGSAANGLSLLAGGGAYVAIQPKK